ncbi:hypothetical protein TraAM80_07629 [Trypanosoma rangeli]|uniref:Uncharacterized protein n=1 Tax=Trypanosoma rangeli TaxID=5698 RepID=A0A3R7RDK2_TRYRA|nr:uncharacterized protein TraAM80_07629 [Trypanosoma rangeli]RNF00450.1 hypothetical protein TraAM80_07629 [Trypanosoma rangeli]|eukprot:RNF00450.1 hypothetical protein TraAM80_07629 [Trypanosoma rangeli]
MALPGMRGGGGGDSKGKRGASLTLHCEAMRSVFDIARSHITLPVTRDVNALRQVLRDWHHYTEKLQLQEKTTHPAALCVTVHPSRKTTASPLRSFAPQSSQGHTVADTYTRRVPLRLWTAVLPWEVQRGLSMSELRLSSTPERQQDVSKGDENSQHAQEMAAAAAAEVEGEEEDPFGVVTAASPGRSGAVQSPRRNVMACNVTSPATSVSPGMLFVLDAESAAQGVSFWSGAILQSVDVAFISPVEPVVTNSSSFQELRQRQLAAAEGGGRRSMDEKRAVHNLARFFPEGELDSPTVTFAVQSYSHLDPFPRCDRAGGAKGQRRQHMAEPAAVGRNNGDAGGYNNPPRYVLETLRHLLRDSVDTALQECRRLRATAAARSGGEGDVYEPHEEAMEVALTLELSDGLKEELREKARLCTNYVLPLEEHISYHIRRQNSSDEALQRNQEAGRAAKEDTIFAPMGEVSAPPPGALAVVAKRPIHLAQPNKVGATSAMPLRSPMLAEEHEDLPSHLVPSVKGKHESPVLRSAEREQNQLISARALAQYPNTSSHIPALPPIDYELFDLCLRLGVSRKDVIYYFYGRIIWEWQKELQRLRKHPAGASSSAISDADIRRMLLLVRDPSLQVPEELLACVETVARRRNLQNEVQPI